MFIKKKRLFIVLAFLAICLLMSESALAVTLEDMEERFLQSMRRQGYSPFEILDYRKDSYFITIQDRAANAPYDSTGWNYGYSFSMEGDGPRMGQAVTIEYNAALDRSLNPSSSRKEFAAAYKSFLEAAGMQFSGRDRERFNSKYAPSRVWQVLSRAMYADYNPYQLSEKIGDWEISVDVAYGENEMHFFFYMSQW